MGHTRKTIQTLLVLLLPAGVGIATVQASPTCERYVRTYVTVPVRNKVSKATATAWAKWRKAHPNWKPNPHAQRPRYKMTRKEQVEKVAFACQVPTDPEFVQALFTPVDLKPPTPDLDAPGTDTPVAPPFETAELTYPGDLPPVSTTPPAFGNPSFPPSLTPPFLPPVSGPLPPPTTSQSTPPPNLPPVAVLPEPSGWLLLATGMATTPLFLRRRRVLAAAASRSNAPRA